jgi:hypothetical protein
MQGLRWHYDMCGAEPIIRDVRVYNSGALSRGTAMCSGPVATAENGGAAIIADPDVLSNIIGVLQEDLTTAQTLGVVATGVDKYGKLIINPFAVWLGEYSQHADDDVVNSVADSTGKAVTITQVTDHNRAWAYITDAGATTGGFGNLFQVGAITNTTVLTAATSYDDYLLGNTTSDTVIVLIPPFSADVAGGSVNLSAAAGGYASRTIEPYNASAAAGAAVVLENYIESPKRSMTPLVCAEHSGKNYKAEDPTFYADIMFSEHVLGANGPNARVIN